MLGPRRRRDNCGQISPICADSVREKAAASAADPSSAAFYKRRRTKKKTQLRKQLGIGIGGAAGPDCRSGICSKICRRRCPERSIRRNVGAPCIWYAAIVCGIGAPSSARREQFLHGLELRYGMTDPSRTKHLKGAGDCDVAALRLQIQRRRRIQPFRAAPGWRQDRLIHG